MRQRQTSMFILMLAVVTCLFARCTTTPNIFAHGPLLDQRLAARPGAAGVLTNQVCSQYEGTRCIAMDVVTYDLAQAAIRSQLRDLKFICDVGCVRYRIASDRPGLVSQTENVSKFLGIVTSRTIVELSYVDAVKDWQRLVNANAFCAAQDSALGQTMFDECVTK